ncbi:Hypothetical predicted protein [Xyrichtys novacula]|uniref:Uncharacterized protein n=1 Tax=Xyrichtys novacula TaxID=13765 RepID=A0AAV1F3A7_XYRNO|nr:Hypothetical predicted protein [Xyrichtys novacula]
MAPVTGSATARLLLNSFILAIFTAYVIISARISNGCVSAIRIYDRDSLFRIKESMKGLFDTWGDQGKEARVLESRSNEDALQLAWNLSSAAMENEQGVYAGSLSSMCVTAHPRCHLPGPQGQFLSLHSAGVLVSGFHRVHALLCLRRSLLHCPAGADVTAGLAFDQSRCVPQTLPP